MEQGHKYVQDDSAFTGIAAYETEPGFMHNTAVNTLFAELHKAHLRKAVYYYYGMRYEDFYCANTDFMRAFALAFLKERKLALNYTIIKDGINHFIETMEYMHIKTPDR